MVVLTDQCAIKKVDRDILQEKYKDIELKLNRAEILMKSLGHEKVRKKEKIKISILRPEQILGSLEGDTL